MVQVSDKFKELAGSAGRHVFCKILVGGDVILDDKILEFDFDDLVHPDWMTIGTACANRFSFSAIYEKEIGVQSAVKPYVSFDGEEWCPLGVFFVTRRYIRGKYASIICYDKMYSLDKDYACSISAPTTTSALLREICSNNGITCSNYGEDIEVRKIPSDCTVKDVIGYIAAVNYCNAKFNREGSLVLIKYSACIRNFILQPENCMNFSRNLTKSVVKHVTVDTGEAILESGDGSRIASVELFNPFMTPKLVHDIQMRMLPIGFYGAELEMQGMPFLEAGETLLFEETPGYLYSIATSEIDYHYDGALTAKLYSKNRSYTNSAVHKDELEAELEEIRASLGNEYRKQINEKALTLSTAETTAAEFAFDTKKTNVFAQVDLNFTVDGGGSNSLTAAVYVNGSKARESVHTVNGSSRELLHFYYLAENLPRGSNTITVTLRTESGQMTIQSGQLIATLVGKGMAGGGQNVRDRATIFEVIPTISLSCFSMQICGLSENLQTEIKEA